MIDYDARNPSNTSRLLSCVDRSTNLPNSKAVSLNLD
jgi:hypothetical protein